MTMHLINIPTQIVLTMQRNTDVIWKTRRTLVSASTWHRSVHQHWALIRFAQRQTIHWSKALAIGSQVSLPWIIGSALNYYIILIRSQLKCVVFFFIRKIILQQSPSIDESGHIVWQLVVALFVSWVLVYLILFLGVKVSGKVVYFTALFPYVILIILGIRGWILPGAGKHRNFNTLKFISFLC